MPYIISIILGYLFGCSSMAYYIGKIKKVKLKEVGSKNYGASNTVAMVGFKAGLLVFIHDVLKSFLAVIVVNSIFPETPYVGAIAGISAVLGHIFPFYLKFDGGKGFASYMGALLAINPIFALCIMGIALAVALLVDYVIVGTFIIICVAPIYFLLIQQNIVLGLIFLLASAIIAYKHKENIYNFTHKTGKEMRIRAALQKKYKK